MNTHERVHAARHPQYAYTLTRYFEDNTAGSRLALTLKAISSMPLAREMVSCSQSLKAETFELFPHGAKTLPRLRHVQIVFGKVRPKVATI